VIKELRGLGWIPRVAARRTPYGCVDMKNLKPRGRPNAVEALAIAAETAPALPPAQMPASDRPMTLNMRLREISAITAAAKARGMTIKQLIARALSDSGVALAPTDLEDRTPRRGSQGAALDAERYRHVATAPRNAVGSP
jgi:hypothetical protein